MEICQLKQVCFDDDIVHLLANLKQRFSAESKGKPLVYRVEREIKKRYVPKRNKTINEFNRGKAYAKIARDSLADFYKIAEKVHKILNFNSYSEFQFYGWAYVYDALDKKTGLILSAPTGSGKTETFIPPLILKIFDNFKENSDFMALIIYPRTALLKEQAERIFRYVYNAKQNLGYSQDIVIGLQFAGIASNIDDTLRNSDLFRQSMFLLFKCPICQRGNLKFTKNRGKHKLECSNCGAYWRVSLSKETHVGGKQKPNILITTFESLDRLFIHPKFEDLFKRIEAIFIDEVHLFHGIYGAHISNLIKNVEEVKKEDIAKIGISATIANPKEFGSKLFYGKNNEDKLHILDANDKEEFEMENVGCEYLYFIKAMREENSSLEASAFIQTSMLVEHGILKKNEQALAFIDSIDLVKRFKNEIRDAEVNKELWKFRINIEDIRYEGLTCPKTDPCNCEIYKKGECWRVINLGKDCYNSGNDILKAEPINVEEVSSKSISAENRLWQEADLILSTPSLEVGIDQDSILATLHYRAPRSVFSFIQRRGRAGRKSDKAYTFVVLGNTSMDNFYFYKRHRLLDEKNYVLPLNPENQVVQKIHLYLMLIRENIREKYRTYNERALDVIKDFILEFFQSCKLLELYKADLDNLRNKEESNNFIDEFGRWIKKEKENLETYFNVEQIIKFIKEEFPEVTEHADELLNAIVNKDSEKFKSLQNEISKILVEKEREILEAYGRSSDEYREFRETREKLERELDKIEEIDVEKGTIENIDNYYLFFKTLVDKLDVGGRGWLWKSRSIPDVIKAFLQASFYLHLNVNREEDMGCFFSDVDFYLPDAYFQEVKPIVIEVQRGKYKADIVLEDSSMLEYMLIPYKSIYRYSGDTFINVIDTGTNSIDLIEKLDGNKYRITIPIKHEYIKGIDKGESFEVSSLSVKSLRTDDNGKQALKICPECFTLYSFNRRKNCHSSPLRNIRLDAKPVLSKKIKESVLDKTTYFSLNRIDASILIKGSDVKVFDVIERENNVIPTRNERYSLEVRYEKPLSYSLISKGIKWKVDEEFFEKFNEKDKEILLHSGAHVLLKVIASIGGVHEQMLQYTFDVDKGEIYVWERYEGGIGVVDTVFRKIKEEPKAVYKEFVSVVLCPIYLSEDITKNNIKNIENYLKNRITSEFYLGIDSDFTLEVIEEVRKEIERMNDVTEFVCNDGCPVCVHVNYCQSGFNQENEVSRKYAEQLIKSFIKVKHIQDLNNEDLGCVLARDGDKAYVIMF